MPTLSDPGIVNQFTGDCRNNVFHHWNTLVVTRRAALVHQAACRALSTCGIPNPTLQLLGSLNGGGLFDFSTWQLKVDPNSFDGAQPPARAAFVENICTIYHEARHCEQWFHMARYAAVGHGVTAATLAASLSIPVTVANTALTRKMGLADPLLALTKGWHESVYGGQSAFREIALARVGLRRAGHDRLMHAFRNGAHQNYSGNLPEEADAWGIERLVDAAYPP